MTVTTNNRRVLCAQITQKKQLAFSHTSLFLKFATIHYMCLKRTAIFIDVPEM